MFPELHELFAAQAAWQRARAQLSWAEKLRIAETMRETARSMSAQHRQQVVLSVVSRNPKDQESSSR